MLFRSKVTLGHDTKIKSDRLEKVKSAVKKVGKTVARGAGYAAGAAVRGAKAAGREFSKGYQRGSGGSSASSSGSSASSSSATGTKRTGLLGRIGSALKSGLKKAVAKGARAVSRGARNVARRMEGGSSSSSPAKPASKPASKAEKPADPWKGSETVPAKAKTKKAAAKPAKSKRGKLSSKADEVLASLRSEEIKLNEKTLTTAETKKKEEIVMSMKDKAADFEKRYPGRGKEVMYATATKMAKKVAEQAMELQPTVQQPTSNPQQAAQDQKAKIAAQRAKQAAINLKQKELATLRSTPAGTAVSTFG